MAEDWRTAFFDQARSDYKIFLLLVDRGEPLCHCLHYLQMLTEKLAKGYATSVHQSNYPRGHEVFSKFVGTAKDNSKIKRACNIKNDAQFTAYLGSLKGIAQQVQELVPTQKLERSNAEYPWEGPNGVVAPVDYHFAGLELRDAKMIKLLKFIERCFAAI